MKKFIVFLTMLMSAPVAFASNANASSWCTPEQGVAVFGDSMTVNAQPYLPSTYKIDAQWGRGVSLLDDRISLYLSKTVPPKVAVIALGTNEQAGWTKADYARSISMFTTKTKIVFVTTYRPLATSDGAVYSQWMKELAATRAGSQIADWRAYAMENPAAISSDGLHQSESGKQAWSILVQNAVNKAMKYYVECS